jgi:hypothetical protein
MTLNGHADLARGVMEALGKRGTCWDSASGTLDPRSQRTMVCTQ